VCSYGCMAFLWVRSTHFFANLSACMLSSMLTCALTLYNVIGWERFWSSLYHGGKCDLVGVTCVVWDV
jgi:hypothetical protein